MVLLVTFLASPVSNFLLDNQCFVTPPCVCEVLAVQCNYRALDRIPDFKVSDYHYQRLSIYLKGNNISKIENSSFENLDSINASALVLDLSQNRISDIAIGAFAGVEAKVQEIDVENNDLTTIPEAFGKLLLLESLKIRGNPIRTLATPVTFILSRTVSTLALSLNLFQTWPRELHYFRLLSKLSIDGYQLSRLPLNAMEGFETTLTSLDITHSKLDRIPSVVCHLKKLRHLSYTSNPDTADPIFEHCSQLITSVYFLSIQDNNISHFPDILKTFVNLDYFDISENRISTIDSSLIPANSVTHLNLSTNYFNRVPSAVNSFPELKSLYLTGNHITSIEDYDLVNLTHLTVLQLGDNPIEYVSDNAFVRTPLFKVLNLENTALNVIPRAVTTLTDINRFDIEGTPIDCSCKMDYMKVWSSNASHVHGTCEGTGESLADFITNVLPLCP